MKRRNKDKDETNKKQRKKESVPNLTKDVLGVIFRQMCEIEDYETLTLASEVCKKWHSVSRGRHLWKRMCERRWGTTELLVDPKGDVDWISVFRENFLLIKSKQFRVVRKRFVPILDAANFGKDGSVTDCKFGGTPLGGFGMAPFCESCGSDMCFAFQLNLWEMPPTMVFEREKRMFQFFNCFADCGTTVARIVDITEEMIRQDPREELKEDGTRDFIPKKIMGWDVEDSETREIQDLELPSSQSLLYCHRLEPSDRSNAKKELLLKNFRDVRGFEGCEIPCERNLPSLLPSIFHVGGFPCWTGPPDYNGECSECGEKNTKFVVQVESQGPLDDFMWGDNGTAQILQCAKHRCFTLAWACDDISNHADNKN